MYVISRSAIILVLFSLLLGCKESKESKQPTNVILMLADDMGYSDIASFGSEVPTPNIDKLIKEGTRFTQFYNGARCCPTRASLLTGTFAHQAGVGYMTAPWEEDAYQGHLSDKVLTIGEVMQSNGYTTFHTGKWHVGNPKNGQTPTKRGFDQSWWRKGRVNYFDKSPGMILLNDEGWTTEDSDYYLTDYTANFTSQFIEEAVRAQKPFFGYIGWDACHWPLQAKEQYIALYRDTYKAGWDQIREGRIAKQQAVGLIDTTWQLRGRDEAIPAWDQIPEQEKGRWVEKMASYAAQLHSLDENIGRVMKKIEDEGVADNTVILLLFDNGACAEAIGWNDPHMPGTPESYISYNMPWANVSNTPFRSYKHFLYEGGISTPMVVWGLENAPAEIKSMGHIVDVMPTILDITEGTYPKTPTIHKMEGKSLLPAIRGEKEATHEWMFWEHEGNRAVRYGDWKLISRFKNDTTYFSRWHFPKEPRKQEWELYNIAKDRTEQFEVSGNHPELVAKMESKWQKWADRVGVLQNQETYDGTRLKIND